MGVSENIFGVGGSRHHTPAEIDEHAIINGVHGKKVFVVQSDGNVKTASSYILFDPDDSQPTYIGVNDDSDANTTDIDWTIYKFLYSGSNTTSIRKKTGAWDNRSSLF